MEDLSYEECINDVKTYLLNNINLNTAKTNI